MRQAFVLRSMLHQQFTIRKCKISRIYYTKVKNIQIKKLQLGKTAQSIRDKNCRVKPTTVNITTSDLDDTL